jgi:uncharacterized protein YegL
MSKLIQPLKNHVAILIDVSGSMSSLLPQVQKVFQNQIEFLRKKSLVTEQETRVSVYLFDTEVKCLIFDVDVARPIEIGTLKPGGYTSLLDAMWICNEDFSTLPEKYGDHSFITYILTDGMENSSKVRESEIKRMIKSLPDNKTICAFAPDMNGVEMLKAYGIPSGNIEKWDTTQKGVEEVGNKFERTMNNFYEGRKTGTRSFSTMFADLNKVTASDIKKVATEVTNFNIVINEGVKAVEIKPLVEKKLNISYVKGKSYYELVKRETIQENKLIAVQDKKTEKVYVGYDARVILNLPTTGAVKVDPVQSSKWNVYVQSNAVNRNIIPKQRVLVLN